MGERPRQIHLFPSAHARLAAAFADMVIKSTIRGRREEGRIGGGVGSDGIRRRIRAEMGRPHATRAPAMRQGQKAALAKSKG